MNLNLNIAKSGKLLVIRVEKGTKGKKRLSALGIVPGVEIEKLENSKKRGPVIFKVKGTNMMIGGGLAASVIVEQI
jgi:Fe2+ transport system protein FeoA